MISSSAVAVEEVVAKRGTHVSGAGGGVGAVSEHLSILEGMESGRKLWELSP